MSKETYIFWLEPLLDMKISFGIKQGKMEGSEGWLLDTIKVNIKMRDENKKR